MKVGFIAGWGRSGTTLLDGLLGQIEGVQSAGELRYVWDRGLLEARPCGCGEPLRACPVWSRVLTEYLDLSSGELERIVRIRESFRTRDCVLPWRRSRAQSPPLLDYARHLGGVIQKLARVTGSRVVVDSSKFPSHGYLLEQSGALDLRVIHLVRDPRAVAYSWRRRKLYDTTAQGPQYIEPHSLLRSTAYWISWNLVVDRLWGSSRTAGRYVRLRYEDLVRRPHRELQRIADLLDENWDLSFLEDPGAINLKPLHMVSGNPVRFQHGPLRLIPDDEWRSAMPRLHRLAVMALTWPLLRRYGYSGRSESGVIP